MFSKDCGMARQGESSNGSGRLLWKKGRQRARHVTPRDLGWSMHVTPRGLGCPRQRDRP